MQHPLIHTDGEAHPVVGRGKATTLALSGFFSTDLPAGVSLPRPPEQIDQIADLFKRETYQKEDIIWSQGDPGDSMYVIRSGIVSIFKEVAGQEIYVSDLKRGGFFGEISLLSDAARNATIRVSLDTTVYCLTRENFEILIKRNKSIGLYLSRYYAKRMVLEEKNHPGKKNVPVFYAVSATGPDLGGSHFLYTVSFHISDESKKRVLVIEPHLLGKQADLFG